MHSRAFIWFEITRLETTSYWMLQSSILSIWESSQISIKFRMLIIIIKRTVAGNILVIFLKDMIQKAICHGWQNACHFLYFSHWFSSYNNNACSYMSVLLASSVINSITISLTDISCHTWLITVPGFSQIRLFLNPAVIHPIKTTFDRVLWLLQSGQRAAHTKNRQNKTLIILTYIYISNAVSYVHIYIYIYHIRNGITNGCIFTSTVTECCDYLSMPKYQHAEAKTGIKITSHI